MKLNFVLQKYYNKNSRLAAETAVSHERCSQYKGPGRTAQLLIPRSHPACQHQSCWCATQERESLCANEKQAHFIKWCAGEIHITHSGHNKDRLQALSLRTRCNQSQCRTWSRINKLCSARDKNVNTKKLSLKMYVSINTFLSCQRLYLIRIPNCLGALASYTHFACWQLFGPFGVFIMHFSQLFCQSSDNLWSIILIGLIS